MFFVVLSEKTVSHNDYISRYLLVVVSSKKENTRAPLSFLLCNSCRGMTEQSPQGKKKEFKINHLDGCDGTCL